MDAVAVPLARTRKLYHIPYGPLWAAPRVRRACPSDLCKPDLAQPVPVCELPEPAVYSSAPLTACCTLRPEVTPA